MFIILVLVLAGGGYYWYQSGSSAEAPSAPEVTDADLETRLQELRRLKDIHLDTAVFEDPAFKSLRIPQSIGTTTTIKSGRENPFLPF